MKSRASRKVSKSLQSVVCSQVWALMLLLRTSCHQSVRLWLLNTAARRKSNNAPMQTCLAFKRVLQLRTEWPTSTTWTRRSAPRSEQRVFLTGWEARSIFEEIFQSLSHGLLTKEFKHYGRQFVCISRQRQEKKLHNKLRYLIWPMQWIGEESVGALMCVQRQYILTNWHDKYELPLLLTVTLFMCLGLWQPSL